MKFMQLQHSAEQMFCAHYSFIIFHFSIKFGKLSIFVFCCLALYLHNGSLYPQVLTLEIVLLSVVWHIFYFNYLLLKNVTYLINVNTYIKVDFFLAFLGSVARVTPVHQCN